MTINMRRKVLVAGATGQQGGSVVKALLQDGHTVIGITRNQNSEKAKSLLDKGVQLVSLDFTKASDALDILREVDAVFAMTTPSEGGIEGEIEQGVSLANAANKAGVEHYIFNSVGDADLSTGIPHFESKWQVEKHLKTLGMPYTIVAPAYFMDNLFFPFMTDSLKEGKLKMAMTPERKLQQIAVDDIGKFVARVVHDRDQYFGQRINISGDELSGKEAATILSEVLGRDIVYEGYDPIYMKESSEDMYLMFKWFNEGGYTANLNSLKPYGFKKFREWAIRQDWSVLN
jgi:uncharacterized protein YbjT (DUF2867 family)